MSPAVRQARSVLLPSVGADLAATHQQFNLAASGFGSIGSPFPGFSFPSVVGPCNVVDLRARLSQSVVDVTSRKNYRAAREGAAAAEWTTEDARDLVVLAVGGSYLQALAARAELQTAEALFRQTADRKAAGLAAQVRAAELALSAARSERLPTVAVSGDYGTLGSTLGNGRTTFSVAGRVHVPVFDGGRTSAHVQQAEAAVAQRQAELDDLTSQVEADIRRALLDLTAATSQVDLAQRNVAVTREALGLTRQRFEAGVSDSIEVVQAQEAVATAELDYINGVFAHNLAKLALARASGEADERLADYVRLP